MYAPRYFAPCYFAQTYFTSGATPGPSFPSSVWGQATWGSPLWGGYKAPSLFIPPTGIATAGAVGTPVIVTGAVSLVPTGIATAGAVGTPVALRPINVVGIASGQAFGLAEVKTLLGLYPSGVASLEAFSAPQLVPGGITITAVGFSQGGAVGTPTTTFPVKVVGIASAEAIGVPVTLQGVGTVRVVGKLVLIARPVGEVIIDPRPTGRIIRGT